MVAMVAGCGLGWTRSPRIPLAAPASARMHQRATCKRLFMLATDAHGCQLPGRPGAPATGASGCVDEASRRWMVATSSEGWKGLGRNTSQPASRAAARSGGSTLALIAITRRASASPSCLSSRARSSPLPSGNRTSTMIRSGVHSSRAASCREAGGLDDVRRREPRVAGSGERRAAIPGSSLPSSTTMMHSGRPTSTTSCGRSDDAGVSLGRLHLREPGAQPRRGVVALADDPHDVAIQAVLFCRTELVRRRDPGWERRACGRPRSAARRPRSRRDPASAGRRRRSRTVERLAPGRGLLAPRLPA